MAADGDAAVTEERWLNFGGEFGYVALRGCLIDTPCFGKLRSWPDGAIVIDPAAGIIVEVGEYAAVARLPLPQPVRWLHSDRRLVICPGLVDLHTHLPQYPASGRGEAELLPWLRQQIFPLERDFTAAKARVEAPLFFRELARHGTTTAMVYASVHEESCESAFRAAERSGLRVVMGNMMMDSGSYGPIQPKKVVSIALVESERLCKRWHGAADGRLGYAFSPRFALVCTERLMRAAAELAEKYGAYLQTHLAENLGELDRVRHLFPSASDYTHVYERSGVLGARTVLGHCVHLCQREIDALASTGARIAHCPTSNLYMGSGLLPLNRLLDAGIPVGLGSDVAMGPELNLWQVMRSAIEIQRARSFYEPEARSLTPAEAFYMGTLGGAVALHQAERIGTLDAGKEADVLALDLDALLPYASGGNGPGAAIPPAELLNLCIYRGGPHATVAAYVRGRTVYQAREEAMLARV